MTPLGLVRMSCLLTMVLLLSTSAGVIVGDIQSRAAETGSISDSQVAVCQDVLDCPGNP